MDWRAVEDGYVLLPTWECWFSPSLCGDLKFEGFFLEDIEAGFEVDNCVTEQGGVIGILQICQMVAAQSGFCDCVADLSHKVINYAVKRGLGLPHNPILLQLWQRTIITPCYLLGCSTMWSQSLEKSVIIFLITLIGP